MGEGVYHHWDGCPAGLGTLLFKLFHEKHQGNMEQMLKEIVDGHPCGWSCLAERDCYCHARGLGAEGYELRDLEWAIRKGLHWAYLFGFEDGELIIGPQDGQVEPGVPRASGGAVGGGGHRAAERR